MVKELNNNKITKNRTNKINDFFNLTFNANYIKKLLLNEINIRNYNILKIKDKNNKNNDNKEKNNKENNEVNTLISISNSYIIITKFIELLLNDIIKETIPYCKKDITDTIFILSFNDLKYGINNSDLLKSNFIIQLLEYNDKYTYQSEVLSYEALKNYILTINKCIRLENDAYRFLIYLIYYNISLFLKTSYEIMKCFNKTKITSKIINGSWNIIYKDKFLDHLLVEMDILIKLIDDYKVEEEKKLEEKKIELFKEYYNENKKLPNDDEIYKNWNIGKFIINLKLGNNEKIRKQIEDILKIKINLFDEDEKNKYLNNINKK